MAKTELKGSQGLVPIALADFEAAAKEGNTRFDNNVKLKEWELRDYIDKNTGNERTIALVTITIGDNGVADGVIAKSMLQEVRSGSGVDLVATFIGKREYNGTEFPNFRIRAKA